MVDRAWIHEAFCVKQQFVENDCHWKEILLFAMNSIRRKRIAPSHQANNKWLLIIMSTIFLFIQSYIIIWPLIILIQFCIKIFVQIPFVMRIWQFITPPSLRPCFGWKYTCSKWTHYRNKLFQVHDQCLSLKKYAGQKINTTLDHNLDFTSEV